MIRINDLECWLSLKTRTGLLVAKIEFIYTQKIIPFLVFTKLVLFLFVHFIEG